MHHPRVRLYSDYNLKCLSFFARPATAYTCFFLLHTLTMPVKDPSSFANTSDIVTTHLHLNWTISFEERKIAGNVVLDLVALKDNVDKVVLDTSYLDIRAVYVNDAEAKVIRQAYMI